MIELNDKSSVTLEDFMGGDNRVCMSAWVSFGNDHQDRLQDRRRVEKLINFLYSNQHMTPFESSVFTFRIKTPIFVAREYHRHRTQGINEYSGRYAEMLPEFYLPNADRPLVQQGKPGKYYFTPGTDGQYETLVKSQRFAFVTAWSAYQNMLEAGIAKEVARNVLPVATYTYFYSTMNSRNLMHFLDLRTHQTALQEIQQVAGQMEEHFKQQMPLTYKAWKGNKCE